MTGIQGRLRPWVPVVVPALGVAAATLALHLRDPHQSGSWGFCPSALVGLDCPGCGGLRAVHHLTDGNLMAAASSNLLVVLAIPFAVLWWIRAVARVAAGEERPWYARVSPWVWGPTALLVLAFVLLRNLPVAGALGEWLAS